MATEFALSGLGVLSGVFCARVLAPEGRGALAAVLFWPQLLAGIALLSLPEAVTYRLGRTQGQKTDNVAASGLALASIQAVLAIIVGVSLIPSLLGSSRTALWSLARWTVVAFVPFNFLALVLLAIDQGRRQFARFNSFRLLVPAVYLLMLLFLWMGDSVSVQAIAIAIVLATVVTALVRLVVQLSSLAAPTVAEMRELLSYAVRFHPSTLLLIAAIHVDQILALVLWDNTGLGHYVVAAGFASAVLGAASGAFQKVLFPSVAASDPTDAVWVLSRGVRHSTFILFGLVVMLLISTPILIRALYGSSFGPAAAPAAVLVLAQFLAALQAVMIQGSRGLGEGRAGAIAAAVSGGVTVAVAWTFAETLTLTGLAVARTAANAAAVASLVFVLSRRFGLAPMSFWGLTATTAREVLQVARAR